MLVLPEPAASMPLTASIYRVRVKDELGVEQPGYRSNEPEEEGGTGVGAGIGGAGWEGVDVGGVEDADDAESALEDPSPEACIDDPQPVSQIETQILKVTNISPFSFKFMPTPF